jgi:membrane-associated phospholipid phosphatase
MKAMRVLAPYIQNAVIFLMVLFLCFTTAVEAQAGDGIETAGDVLLVLLPATAAGLTIGHKDGAGALQFGGSEALTLGVTFGLKYTVNETRPNGGKHSFPSGHTSISFSAAEFMRKRYGWTYGIPAYLAASFVAYSRVESRQHHAQDVIAGAGIGILSSYLFTKPYKDWHVQAEAGRYYGIKLSHDW